MILLTDGGASPTGLVELTRLLQEQFDVSLSAIAIGRNPAEFLERMAEVGAGNYYEVDDVAQVPLIFAQETVLASRSYIVEEPLSARVTGSSAIMDGIGNLPSLRGYVATTPKVAAQRILSGPEPYSDPILASWQYGLGRVVAWTSDASARWANEWVVWDGFSRFWGQVVNWSINAGSNKNLETRILMEDERARIVVDARDDAGEFLDGLLLSGAVMSPDGDSRRIPLLQTAPGQYEATFEPQSEGAYFLTVSGSAELDAQETSLTDLNGWVLSYSPEYVPRASDDRLLTRIAEITGGSNLAERPADVFAHNLGDRQAATGIWQSLILLALLLLPFDIAIRRLIIARSDLDRLRAWLTGRRSQEEMRSERVSALLNVRSRTRQATGYGESQSFEPRPDGGDAPGPRAGQPQPTRQEPAGEASAENLGARLLRNRGRRERDE